MLYLCVILFSMIIITLVDYFIIAKTFSLNFFEIFLAVTIATVAEIIIDLIIAFLVRRALPKRWFSVNKKQFIASKSESKFYEKIGIKRWKDKVLELGALSGFRKNKIYQPKNNEYVERFILEANYGIAVHIACIILGFFVVFIYPLKVALWFGVPVAIVNVLLNLLPIFVLRYNLPKLHKLYKYNEKRINLVENP